MQTTTTLLRDTMEIAGSDSFVCGPVFHVEKLLSYGENWFEAAADGRVLVWFAPQDGMVCGLADAPRSEASKGRHNPFAVYQKTVGSAPDTVAQMTVLVPLGKDDVAAVVAARLKEQYQAGLLFPSDLKTATPSASRSE